MLSEKEICDICNAKRCAKQQADIDICPEMHLSKMIAEAQHKADQEELEAQMGR